MAAAGSFSFAAPTIWDSLPEPIRNHDGISKFKTSIKTFLLKENFNLSPVRIMYAVKTFR